MSPIVLPNVVCTGFLLDDEAAAQHARMLRFAVIEHASLAGRDPLFADKQFDARKPVFDE